MTLLIVGLGVVTTLALLPASPRLPAAVRAPTSRPDDLGTLRRLRVPLAGLCVLGVWLFLGGVVGLVGGGIAAGVAWRVLSSGEGPEARRRREELESGLPFAVHLLGACLHAGSAVSTSLDAVGTACGGVLSDEFGRLHARLTLGSDPEEVWTELAARGPLAPLGRAMTRAHRSGASVGAAIDQLSEDLRGATRGAAQTRARTVEVRAAAPLGLCLLPSFLLLGVVPLTAGLFSSLDFLG